MLSKIFFLLAAMSVTALGYAEEEKVAVQPEAVEQETAAVEEGDAEDSLPECLTRY